MNNILTSDEIDLKTGTKDAVHVPIVVVTVKESCNARDWVKFTSNEYIEVEQCDKKDSIGIINPFGQSYYYPNEECIIFLNPDTTSSVRHDYDIIAKSSLEAELIKVKENDPNCAECYKILNNEIVRM